MAGRCATWSRSVTPVSAAPEFIAMVREHGVAVVLAGDPDYPQIADITAPFVYARIMGTRQKGGIG